MTLGNYSKDREPKCACCLKPVKSGAAYCQGCIEEMAKSRANELELSAPKSFGFDMASGPDMTAIWVCTECTGVAPMLTVDGIHHREPYAFTFSPEMQC